MNWQSSNQSRGSIVARQSNEDDMSLHEWCSIHLMVKSIALRHQWVLLNWSLTHSVYCLNLHRFHWRSLAIVNFAFSAPCNHGTGTTRSGRLHITSLLVLTQDTKPPSKLSSGYSTSTLFNCHSCHGITAVFAEWPEGYGAPTDGEVEINGNSVRIVFRFNVSYFNSIETYIGVFRHCWNAECELWFSSHQWDEHCSECDICWNHG